MIRHLLGLGGLIRLGFVSMVNIGEYRWPERTIPALLGIGVLLGKEKEKKKKEKKEKREK